MALPLNIVICIQVIINVLICLLESLLIVIFYSKLDCWKFEADERPDMQAVASSLNAMISSKQNDPITYVDNISNGTTSNETSNSSETVGSKSTSKSKEENINIINI